MSKAWPVEDLDPADGFEANARRILAVRMAEYYSYTPIVDREDAGVALHNLRIAAKRLRYTLELFKRVFGAGGTKQLNRVKAIQEELGALHDHDVRIALIEDELGGLTTDLLGDLPARLASGAESDLSGRVANAVLAPDDERRGLIALLEREHERRRQRYHAFHDLWQRHATAGMRADLAKLSTLSLTPNHLEGQGNA